MAWQTPPWVNSGETVDATDREEPGEERTSELDTDAALARLDALDDRGDGDDRDADAADLDSAVALFAETLALHGVRETNARLLRPADRERRA